MGKRLLLLLTAFLSLAALASDSIPLRISSRAVRQGDSIHFSWAGRHLPIQLPLGTVHLWIDELETGRRWIYRYPILNWESDGVLAVSDKLEGGTYAFNFLVSQQFLEISGEVKKLKIRTALNHKTGKTDTIMLEESPGLMGKQIPFAFMGKEGLLFDSTMLIDGLGKFKIPPVVFGDTVNLILDAERYGDRYRFDMKTPLDTTFTPLFVQRFFVQVEGPDGTSKKSDTSLYVFSSEDKYLQSITLEEVKVSGLNEAERFEKDYVSPWFKGSFHKTYSFLNSDELLRYSDIWTFVQSRTPGVIVSSMGGILRSAVWRGFPVRVFLDEMLVNNTSDLLIQPMEVAMIKIFPPNTSALNVNTPGGAIAIYTRRGGNERLGPPRYNYVVKGYTQPEIRWE